MAEVVWALDHFLPITQVRHVIADSSAMISFRGKNNMFAEVRTPLKVYTLKRSTF